MTNRKRFQSEFPPDFDWAMLLHGKSWEAALPSSLSDARLEHMWASCQPSSKCQPLLLHLRRHLLAKRYGLTLDQISLEAYEKMTAELEKVINAERDARLSAKHLDARLAEKHFLAALDELLEPLVKFTTEEPEKPSEPDCDSAYRAAYADDEASMQLKHAYETVEKVWNSGPSNFYLLRDHTVGQLRTDE